MAKTSFKNAANTTAETPQTPVTESAESAPSVQTTALSTFGSSGQFEGEFDASDVNIPYLALVNKSGKLIDDFPNSLGNFIFDKSFDLGKPISIIVAKVRKYFVESVDFDDDILPKRFETKAEAVESGLDYYEQADLDLLVEVDADSDSDFASMAQFEHEEKAYILARYSVKKGGYKATVGILARDIRGFLGGDLASGRYELTSAKRAYKQNTWMEPRIRACGKLSPELRSLIQAETGL